MRTSISRDHLGAASEPAFGRRPQRCSLPAGSRQAGLGLVRGRRCGLGRDFGFPRPAGVRRPAVPGRTYRLPRPRVEGERVEVDDHLAALRREVRTMPGRPGCRSRRADRRDDEHLGAAGAVQLDDPAQLLAGRSGRQPLELVPTASGRARAARRACRSRGRRRGAAPPRRVRHLTEPEPPAGPSATGTARRWSAGGAPSGYRTAPATNRSSGRSVRSSTRSCAAQAAQVAHEPGGPRGARRARHRGRALARTRGRRRGAGRPP